MGCRGRIPAWAKGLHNVVTWFHGIPSVRNPMHFVKGCHSARTIRVRHVENIRRGVSLNDSVRERRQHVLDDVQRAVIIMRHECVTGTRHQGGGVSLAGMVLVRGWWVWELCSLCEREPNETRHPCNGSLSLSICGALWDCLIHLRGVATINRAFIACISQSTSRVVAGVPMQSQIHISQNDSGRNCGLWPSKLQ